MVSIVMFVFFKNPLECMGVVAILVACVGVAMVVLFLSVSTVFFQFDTLFHAPCVSNGPSKSVHSEFLSTLSELLGFPSLGVS